MLPPHMCPILNQAIFLEATFQHSFVRNTAPRLWLVGRLAEIFIHCPSLFHLIFQSEYKRDSLTIVHKYLYHATHQHIALLSPANEPTEIARPQLLRERHDEKLR